MATHVTDALNRLTIGELDAGSRLLKTDLVTAISEHTMHKWAGLAIVAFLIDRRTDPSSQLATYRAMTPDELAETLGLVDEEEPDAEAADPLEADDLEAPPAEAAAPAPPAAPVSMTPAQTQAAAQAAEASIKAAVAADPTAPSPGPSSPGRGAAPR